MKRFKNPKKASALITVLMFVGVLSVLTASLLKYSISERRFNERQRMILRSRNMAENVAVYGSEQITTKLYSLRSFKARRFTGSTALQLPPDDVLTSSFSKPSDVDFYAGLTYTSPLTYIDPTLAENANNPNAGLQISTSTVPIITKSTMNHPAVGSVTTYAEQDLEVSIMPLFQFAVFYNMDMEFGPGPDMTISGPVHTNGDFIARIQTGKTTTLRFTERVTTAKGFYANTGHRGPTYYGDGSVDNGPGGTGPLIFRKPTDAVTGGTDIKSSTGIWRDHKWTSSTTPGSVAETATSQSQFRTFATSTYAGNLRTSLHGVTKLVLPAIGDYDESTTDGRKNGRQIIDPPLSTDQSAVYGTKFGRNAGLYIVVNPDSDTRNGRLPDGAVVAMRARSYRAWINTKNEDGSNTYSEVVLPGQPSYGALNATVNTLPNAYRVDTSIGSNQVLRIPQGGAPDLADTGYFTPTAIPTFSTTSSEAYDAYFYDMRRSFNNTGSPYARSGSNNFRPRPIAKMDLDMTRLKMMIERTLFGNTSSTVYNPDTPNNDNWASNVLNAGAAPASYGLGLAVGANQTFSIFPALNQITAIQRVGASTFTPGPMTFNSSQTNSSGVASVYSTRYKVEETTSTQAAAGTGVNGGYATWTTTTTSSTNSGTYVYTASSASVTAVRLTQYLTGSTSNALDVQIIPVISATTTNAVVAALSDDFYIVPTTLAAIVSPAISSTNPITTDMRIFIDGVDDSSNWTYSASSATGVTASFGTGALNNRYTISALAVTFAGTADITLTASKPNSAYPTQTRTFTIKKASLITGLLASTGYSIVANNGAAPDPYQMYFATSGAPVALSNLVTTGASPWFDGVTIYVHSVDAEVVSNTGSNNSAVRDRVDSGLRLWNGRGSVVSLPSASYAGRTGFSIATNDAVYIVGHFNADGTINSTLSSTGTGGYSGRYPESSSEMLTSIMGDAINVYSQPEFTRDGTSPAYRYYQSSGWSDSMSRNRISDSSSWSSSWQSANPTSSNMFDGFANSLRPALMPNRSASFINAESRTGPMPRTTTTTDWQAARTSKFAPSETEISACLLTGIVPTTKTASSASKQTSGGVHNFPRLSENWASSTPSVALYIRGSLIAMFESQVATEPWGIRWYQGATRNWGLHENLRNANHDVPLEPIVLGARRMAYRNLTKAEYETMKATIQALDP